MGKESKENPEPGHEPFDPFEAGDPFEACEEPGDQSRTRMRAIRILGSRQMSSQAMERRLISKGETTDAARETVQWLEDIGAVNDAEYAASIVTYYSTKGYGLARIRNELFKRGIARDMWDDALAIIQEDENDDAVFQFLEKKLRGAKLRDAPGLSGSLDKNEVRRATDALIRRGFSYEEARSAVGKYLESIENTEEI